MSKRPRIKQADGSLLDLPLDAETIKGKTLEEIALKTDIPTKTSQLENDSGYIPQGGTLSAPLKVTGGDRATAGKIMLDQDNLGQITNTSTQTLFGFTTSTNIAVGHSSYKTNLRGTSIESTANMLTRVIIPVSNNTYTLGSSSNKWKEIHGTTIYQNGKQVANKEDISKANNGYNGFLYAGGDGVTEMGKYIDFHATSTDTKDYDVRFVCPSLDSGVSVYLPSKEGTIALTSDLSNYLPKTSSGEAIINANGNVFRFGGSAGNGTLAVLANTGSSNYLRPGVTGTMDLGTNDEKWKDIYMGGKLTDGTPAAIKPSAGNEISFGSSENSIYFGYDNRVGSAGAVNTYNFGTHSGAAGAYSGRINCGDVYVDGGANQVARKNDLNYKTVGALPDYTVTINHGTAGNPHIIKFVSVNYSSVATCFKMSATTCHDNGISYKHLTDILISITTAGEVYCDIFKFAQQSVGSVDGVARCTGDVFYVNNTSTKVVDFYILCGQYSSSQFTPITRIGSTSIAGVTQYSGNEIGYSGGTKVWANGCGKLITDSSGSVEVGKLYLSNDNTKHYIDVSQFSVVDFTMGRCACDGEYLNINGAVRKPIYYDKSLNITVDVEDETVIVTAQGDSYNNVGPVNTEDFYLQLEGTTDSAEVIIIYRGYK